MKKNDFIDIGGGGTTGGEIPSIPDTSWYNTTDTAFTITTAI